MGSSTENSAYGPHAQSARSRRACPAARRAARPRRSPPASPASRSARRRAARCASPRRSAASSASSRPTVASRGTASWPSPRRSTRSACFGRDGGRCGARPAGHRRRTIRATHHGGRPGAGLPSAATPAARRRSPAWWSVVRAEYFPESLDPAHARAAAIAPLDAPASARRRGARRLAAAHGARDSRVLHRRAGGGLVEPRALRRRALRAACRTATGCAACTRRRAPRASAPR